MPVPRVGVNVLHANVVRDAHHVAHFGHGKKFFHNLEMRREQRVSEARGG